MPKGIYKRKVRNATFRRKKEVKTQVVATPAISITRSRTRDDEVGRMNTICDLRDGEFFRYNYDRGTVFCKTETVCKDTEIVDVLVKRVAFKMDGVWHHVAESHIEHSNYLADVQVCRIALNVTPD